MILACDPGLRGALALYDGGRELLSVKDIPTGIVRINGHDRTAIAELATVRAVETAALMGATHLVIEAVNGMPGQSGPAAFTFGYGVGIVTAAAYATGLIVEKVHPATWKGALGVPASKDGARAKASEFFPLDAYRWPRKMDDGRAEAALIAWWGWLTRGSLR